MLSAIVVLLIVIPNATIIIHFFTQETRNWDHIQAYLLPTLLKNTAILLAFTGVLTILIGVSLAWLISAYVFPLRRFFEWGLILPLAIPPYIAAYAYSQIMSYTGSVQTTLRNHLHLEVNPAYFDIMTLPGAIFIFTLFLYPYVYTITKAFLANQSSSYVENARILGRRSFTIFFRIILPISRVAIVGGVSLVLLEVLNDYGVVQYFGIPTFTTAIFQTWFNMGDLNAAIKLSASLMVIVFAILIMEKAFRGRKKFNMTTTKARPLTPIQLKGWKAWIVFSYCFVTLSFGFFIPFAHMISWMFLTYDQIAHSDVWNAMGHSLLVASLAASIIIICALIVANVVRMHTGIVPKAASRLTILGYSIPGAVIAIGVITVFIVLDQWLSHLFQWIGKETMVVLSTSLVMLLLAYTVRFLAVGYHAVEAGFDRIGTTYTEASRTLGMGITKTFFKVDIHLIKGAIISGFILVFVDILKELPLTLILRPFNFDTLSTKAYQYASNEQIHEASLASIMIIVLSAAAIYLFHYVLNKESK